MNHLKLFHIWKLFLRALFIKGFPLFFHKNLLQCTAKMVFYRMLRIVLKLDQSNHVNLHNENTILEYRHVLTERICLSKNIFFFTGFAWNLCCWTYPYFFIKIFSVYCKNDFPIFSITKKSYRP